MRLTIKNIGIIESADLRLDGITVIAGDNNTGKSTVGKTLFSLFNVLVDIEQNIEKQKYSKILRTLNIHLGDPAVHRDSGLAWRRPTARGLAEVTKNLNRCETKAECEDILTEFVKISEIKDLDIELDKLAEEVFDIKNLPLERLAQSAVSNYFKYMFHSQINNVMDPEADAELIAEIKKKKIDILFQNNVCTKMIQEIPIRNEAVYLDNPFILNRLNYGTSGMDMPEADLLSKLHRNVDAVDDVIQYSMAEEKLQPVMEKLNDVVQGSVYKNVNNSFCYRSDKMNVSMEMSNLSAGLKSFVIIKMLLENGSLKERDILILDEPEIHLHPQWQLNYAELIVVIQKMFDLTILITTHSSHFLEALEFYAEQYGQKDKCSFYLAFAGERGCRVEDVGDEVDKIYSRLVDPGILLNKLKYEQENMNEQF